MLDIYHKKSTLIRCFQIKASALLLLSHFREYLLCFFWSIVHFVGFRLSWRRQLHPLNTEKMQIFHGVQHLKLQFKSGYVKAN